MDKPLMSAKEFSEYTGFPINKIYDLMNRADFPVIQFGRRKFVSMKGFEKWIDEQLEKRKNADCP